MKVIVLNSSAQVGEEVGKIFCDEVNAKHNAVLGLATGVPDTYIWVYDRAVSQRQGELQRCQDLQPRRILRSAEESPQQLLFVYGREPFLEGRYKARKCQFP